MAWNWETNPPPDIPGWSKQQSWAWHNPDPPAGYTWAEYVKAVSDANQQGEEGPRPLDANGNDMAPDMSPMTYLQYNIGYGRLAPLVAADEGALDDRATQQFLDATHYANTATDDFSIFGDQFFTALMGLGLATGGAAAYGAFAPEVVAGGAGAALEGGAGTSSLLGGGSLGGYEIAGAAPELLTAGGLAGAEAPIVAGGVGAAAPAVAGTSGGLLGALGAGGAMTPLGWAQLVASGIGGIGSLVGGITGANAARDAAETQADAAKSANDLLLRMYEQNRADLEPYRTIGYASLGDLMRKAGATPDVGTYTGTAPLDPSGYGVDPSAYAFDPSQHTFDASGYNFGQYDFDPSKHDFSQYGFAPSTSPIPGNDTGYAWQAPEGATLLAQDPGYRFRLEEGRKALEAGAAARGGLLSGGAQKALVRFGQDLGSQEYGNAYNRALGENQLRYQRAKDWERDVYGRQRSENDLRYGRAVDAYGRDLALNQMEYSRAVDTFGRDLALNQMGYERDLAGNELAYGRDVAADERNYARDYQANQDTYGRSMQDFLLRYNTAQGNRQQTWNELLGLANLGMGAQGQQTQANQVTGQQMAGNITSAGAAQAAGRVGATNALNQGFAGVGSAVNSYLNSVYGQQEAERQRQQQQQLLQLLAARR